MPMKRQAPDGGGAPNSIKAPKTKADGSIADYSNDVKKKLNASNRTGQACDRCRIRKMRCDDLPEGCAPCMQNQSPCRTTDRITGIATTRGYVQSLERRLQEMENHNGELQARLLSMGVDVKPSDGFLNSTTAPLPDWNQSQGSGRNHQRWGSNSNIGNPTNSGAAQYGSIADESSATLEQDANLFRLPEFRSGLAGDNYLGVSTGNSFLSSIRGTALNVLGMEIDLADYMSADLDDPDPSRPRDEPIYNKSYRAFVRTAFGTNPKPQRPSLPPKTEGLTYAQWYFRVINPYLPFLHKPSLMSILLRMYDPKDQYKPSAADTVLVHMMFAIMFYQYAARNWENAEQQTKLNNTSNLHYHYALSFYPQLMASHTMHDVQALTMISLHLRSFPKPGACWMMTTTTFNLAIELGLHRSARRWAPTTPKRSPLEIEMRKRIFWSILVIHIIISGKLGRPMAIGVDDYDVELPEAIDDDLLSDDGIDTSRPGKCNFLVGIEVFKIEPIFMDLYNNIYTVKRSPHTYIETVLRLENRIRQCCEQWPRELIARSASNGEEVRVHSQYMNVWELEFRLLLRHPSLSLTSNPEFNNENLNVCMDVSKKMLHHVKQIQAYKSLDTNWQTGALYILAISTTLFGSWERRDRITSAEFATLREDMDSWLSIMGDVGRLLGSGQRLQESVQVTVDKTLEMISQEMASKTASSALSTSEQETSPRVSHHPLAPNPDTYGHENTYVSYADTNNGTADNMDVTNNRNTYPSPNHAGLASHSANTYPQYSYPEPPSASLAPYVTAPNAYDTSNYPSSLLPPVSHQQHTTPQQATAAAANAYLYSQSQPHTSASENSYANATNLYGTTGSQSSWRQWAGNVASGLEPQEYISSASALMQLGGRGEQQSVSNGVVGHQGQTGIPQQMSSAGQPWPFLVFDPAQ